jgi:hypothetical protein
MDQRQKILAASVLVVLVGFVVDRFLWEPWSTAFAEAGQDVKRIRTELNTAEEKARREPDVAKEWKGLRDRLAAVKSEEASNRLATAVDQYLKKHDLKKAALSPEPPAPLAGTPSLREHALALSFQCSWESFVKLLVDLQTTDEFLRVHRMTVQSHYLVEKESYLDITMRLSTVSTAPEKSPK